MGVTVDGLESCAGILFRAKNSVLLVQRSDNGLWETPGGHVELGETEEQAAIRECQEELGAFPEGARWALRRNRSDTVQYLCFVQNVDPFTPTLNPEHTAFEWVAMDALPEPVHPEVRRSVELLGGTEFDVARRIQEGALLSPQKVENVWLFDVRITGTGISYRPSLNEHVFRPPEVFLSDAFLERCNGLPLIFEHPENTVLNTEEYRARAIGTVLLPYLKNDDVWGIAKVYDQDAARLMHTSHASTSPAVVFRQEGSTETVEINGQKLLIEGNPSYLDHLAICPAGVWDKGGEPSGINLGDSNMADKEEMPAWADALVKRMDAMEAHGKADAAEEQARKDAAEKEEKEKADSARKDADEKAEKDKLEAEGKKTEKEVERKDAEAKADSVLQSQQIEVLKAQVALLSAQPSAEDRDALASAQGKAERIAYMFGDSVTGPLAGETPVAYRKRLAAKFQKHSAEFKAVRLDSLDGPVFDSIEAKIYADATTAALNPAEARADTLIPIRETDAAGREITRYHGDPMAWMRPFITGASVARINRKESH